MDHPFHQHHQIDVPQPRAIPKAARVLGWLGVVPFAVLGLAAVVADAGTSAGASFALVLYGMIILAFMGGAQWGLAMRPSAHSTSTQSPSTQSTDALPRRLAISVLPALGALAMAALPTRGALAGLAVLFLALLAYDIATVRAGIAPPWYARLRIELTCAVVLCLLAAAAFGLA